ncbi:MAG: hypothetical protein AB8C84_10490 [Oligoflexales bacterium]
MSYQGRKSIRICLLMIGYLWSSILFSMPQTRMKTLMGFGLEGMRHSFKAGDGNEIIGNSLHTAMSGVYLSQSWFLSLGGMMIIGPHEPMRGQQLGVDFQGAGGSVLWGYSAQDIDLRHRDGGYGFSLGMTYWDTVGRKIGENHRLQGWKSDTRNRGFISQYHIRSNTLALMPGVFFSWLKPERLQGKSPAELETRIEGYVLNIGIVFPLSARYRTRSTHLMSQSLRNRASGSQVEVGDLVEIDSSARGNMDGFSLVVSWTALFGV